ncbi:oxidoreductase [Vibrio zhugei]|uniref:Oxidoreductase n=1 Tax=Vibrio zhugei TaxID=2479546 RepID=A0ABV7C8T8_9VIBR|nr:oxidoreductase [Vibrio zhugei]
MSQAPIKVAIVGYGYSAKTFHLPYILQNPAFEWVAVSSRQSEQLHEQWPDITCYLDPYEMFEKSDADLVIITAPNDVHYPLAKAALLQGKHVILEKPFVIQSSEGEKLIEIADTHHCILSVFQNRRWDGDFMTLRDLITSGKLGDIKYFESHFDRYRPTVRERWRELDTNGGGILFDLGPHLLDQAVCLFGMPEAITAQCRIMRPKGTTVDYVNMTLDYDGCVVNLHANLYSPEPNLRYKVLGTKAKYIKYGLDDQERNLKAGLIPLSESWNQSLHEQSGTVYQEEAEPDEVVTQSGSYHRYFEHIAHALRTGEGNPVPAEEALQSIRLIEAALESHQSGRRIML